MTASSTDDARRPCPVCRRHVTAASRAESADFPFCSARCKLIDLGRWLSGDHRLPGKPVEPTDAETGADTRE